MKIQVCSIIALFSGDKTKGVIQAHLVYCGFMGI